MINWCALLTIFSSSIFSFHDNGDYHMHLGGSVPKKYLLKLAKKDNRNDLIVKLQDDTLSVELFQVTSALLNSKKRLIKAVKSIVEQSSAEYLEIRTGLRSFDNSNNYKPYLEAFLEALRISAKPVKGYLSIDRYKHDQNYIDFIIEAAKINNDVILGIDVSGFMPNKERILVGNLLANTIKNILKNSLKLVIHIGETDTPQEYEDSSIVLNTLHSLIAENQDYKNNVRLGHVIYLTKEQLSVLMDMGLTTEFCPSSFRFLTKNKNFDTNNHPLKKMHEKGYKIVCGTDDELIFKKDFLQEKEAFEGFFMNE